MRNTHTFHYKNYNKKYKYKVPWTQQQDKRLQ